MPTWNQSLAVGHPAIDQQHQELFARADQLSAALKAGRAREEVLHLVGFLRDYTHQHFRSEEELMRGARFPMVEVHEGKHRAFERRLDGLEAKARAGGAASAVALEISALVKGWLVDHIGVEDVKVASFLRDQRAGSARPATPRPAAAVARPATVTAYRPAPAYRAAPAIRPASAFAAKRPALPAQRPVHGAAQKVQAGGRDLQRLAQEAGVSEAQFEIVQRVVRVLVAHELA